MRAFLALALVGVTGLWACGGGGDPPLLGDGGMDSGVGSDSGAVMSAVRVWSRARAVVRIYRPTQRTAARVAMVAIPGRSASRAFALARLERWTAAGAAPRGSTPTL